MAQSVAVGIMNWEGRSLTGGTTRIVYIARYVENLLGKKPEKLIDPDLAVAFGEAVQAAALSGELDSQKDIMITDVAPYALGLRIMTHIYGIPFDNCMDILIPTKHHNTGYKNKAIPNLDRQSARGYCGGISE